jgi:hypothetical protein
VIDRQRMNVKGFDNFKYNKQGFIEKFKKAEPYYNEKGVEVDVEAVTQELMLASIENIFNIETEMLFSDDIETDSMNDTGVKLFIDASDDTNSIDTWHNLCDDTVDLRAHLTKYDKIVALAAELRDFEIHEGTTKDYNTFYWKVKSYFEDMCIDVRQGVEDVLNPLQFLGLNQLDNTTESVLRELNLHFDLLCTEPRNVEYHISKMIYVGNNSKVVSKFLKNVKTVELFGVFADSNESWKTNFIEKKRDETYLSDLESTLITVFNQPDENHANVVFLDTDVHVQDVNTGEFQKVYEYFKQLYLTCKYANKGTKILMKVPSSYFAITRELISVYALLFKRIKIIKPATSLLGSEISYVNVIEFICYE